MPIKGSVIINAITPQVIMIKLITFIIYAIIAFNTLILVNTHALKNLFFNVRAVNSNELTIYLFVSIFFLIRIRTI